MFERCCNLSICLAAELNKLDSAVLIISNYADPDVLNYSLNIAILLEGARTS